MINVNTQQVADRIREIRTKKGITARKMSLELGQSPAYINRIELGRMTPSLSAFLEICEFLDITPHDFFKTKTDDSDDLGEIISTLSDEQRKSVIYIIKQMSK